MKINNKLTGIINEKKTNNSTTFTIRIPHKNSAEINSAIVFNARCCYVVGIGAPNQIWSYALGSRDTTTMTAAINTHTANYVDVDITFSEIVWGGLSVICLK